MIKKTPTIKHLLDFFSNPNSPKILISIATLLLLLLLSLPPMETTNDLEPVKPTKSLTLDSTQPKTCNTQTKSDSHPDTYSPKKSKASTSLPLDSKPSTPKSP
uniref:F-specific ORF protein n=1 Tax=Gibbosula crassa TaxID=2200853 RepID=A0A2S1ZUZ8_9BIVA|nr:F-specific ORF protein [Gibbosula crassa]AWK29312.1 F-specific ORF protein [Gibbosula crassa]